MPCRFHGGAAPQVKAAAKRQAVAAKIQTSAKKALKLNDLGAVGDPLNELLKLGARALKWEEIITERVDLDKIRYASDIGTEQIRAELQLFVQAQREVRETLGLIIKLNLDERLMAIEEGKAQMVMRAITAALRSAGVTGPAEVAAMKVAGRELRLIQGGKAAGY